MRKIQYCGSIPAFVHLLGLQCKKLFLFMLSSFVVLQRKKSQILVYIENKHHGVGEVSELRGFQYISLRKHHNNDEQTLEMSLTMIPIYQYTYEGLIFTVMGIEISSRYYFGG